MSGGLFVGLMSGTSLDGVDAALVRLPEAAPTDVDSTPQLRSPQVLAFVHLPFPSSLRTELLALNTPGTNELHRAALAANGLARVYAQAVGDVLAAGECSAGSVTALGAHGQTVRHRPGEFDGLGYTTQLLNGALLAELSGIQVVCDFRSRDVAAGGQGAPLVPAFHAQVFARPGQDVAVLNLGGIANLTLLPGQAGAQVRGFDCGPGNVLMDTWCQQQRGLAFDADGDWAASGEVLPDLLDIALAEPYFARQPPKSTGRDLFHADWLANCLADCLAGCLARRALCTPAAQDVQATWAELTARTAISALQTHLPRAARLLVCGGGARNRHLMLRLAALGQSHMPGMQVLAADSEGVPAEQVEALAFAWLAQTALRHQPGNLPAVTGALGTRVLGALYPA